MALQLDCRYIGQYLDLLSNGFAAEGKQARNISDTLKFAC